MAVKKKASPKKRPFMRLSDEVKDGMKKAKNAPAREYAKDSKEPALKPAKGLPALGGTTGEKQLNASAQKVKDVAASKTARQAKKRAASPRRAAVDAGLATKSEAVANAKSARSARRAVRRATGKGTQATVKVGAAGGSSVLKGTLKAGGMAKKMAKKYPVVASALAIGASMYATESGKASPKKVSGPKRMMARDASAKSKAMPKAAPAITAKPKAPEYYARPKGQVPASFGSPTKPAGASKASFTIPATAAPKVAVEKREMSLPDRPTLKSNKPDRQIGGLLGRTDGKWHLRHKVGKG